MFFRIAVLSVQGYLQSFRDVLGEVGCILVLGFLRTFFLIVFLAVQREYLGEFIWLPFQSAPRFYPYKFSGIFACKLS